MAIKYDVIIIGSGIGGLTTGTYLAQAGFKTLIIERHEKVGGYCGSFSFNGYRFDEAVHYLNHMRRGGLLRGICDELGVSDILPVTSIDPSDRILMPGLEIRMHRDWRRTADGLSSVFREDKDAIHNFFSLINNFRFSELYVKYKDFSFQDLLDISFKDERLKTVLGLCATTLGLPPHELSALAALAYYKGSILDGGYHPVGGAQAFADAFKSKFQQFGGTLFLKKTVVRIVIKSNRVEGVQLDDGSYFSADTIVSNADATLTFNKLIDAKQLKDERLRKINSLQPSLSMVIVYLGIDTVLIPETPDCCNLWYFPYKNFKEASMDIVLDDRLDGWVHIGLSSLHDRTMAPEGGEALTVFCGASYMTFEYWQENKQRLGNVVFERACRAIPKIRGHIKVNLVASPHTLYRYTLNREGAYRGWNTTPEQSRWGLVKQKDDDIEGLYLVGHWVTTPVGNGGVSTVAKLGRNIAKTILYKKRRKPNSLNEQVCFCASLC